MNDMWTISLEADLSAEEIWPDGDGPDNPTVADVVAVVKANERDIRRGDWGDWDLCVDGLPMRMHEVSDDE